jgi:acetyl-CoA synthetase
VLKELGAHRGSRITIYLPMIPEAAVATLACARIGAIHSIVCGGFSPEALAGRIVDCDSTILITADGGRRGGKKVPLKANADLAATHAPSLAKIRSSGVDQPPDRAPTIALKAQVRLCRT